MKVATASWSPRAGWAELDGQLDSPSTLVVAFCDPGLADDPSPLDKLVECFPTSVVVGCSTAGEIFSSQLLDAGISVGIARFEHAQLRVAMQNVADPSESYDVGRALASSLHEALPGLAGILVLSDGLGVNGSQLAAGLQSPDRLPVPVVGGLAGDGERFQRTWLLSNGSQVDNAVLAVGFYGDVVVRSGHAGGWHSFGPERRVTKSADNVVLELDGKPALDLYRDYLGKRAGELPAGALLFPLLVQAPGEDTPVVRTVLAIDESERSMTFAGDVGVGSTARLMRASRQELIDAAPQSISQPVGETTDTALAIAVSCVGRRLVLGDHTEDELEGVSRALQPGVALVGFYSYGEIAADGSGNSKLHNQTMTVAVISEGSPATDSA